MSKEFLPAENVEQIFKHYNNGCLLPSIFTEFSDKIKSAPIRNDDVLLVSYPRTGSTWCQEILWLILNNYNFSEAQSTLQQIRAPLIESPVYVFEYGEIDPINKILRYKKSNLFSNNINKLTKATNLEMVFTDAVDYISKMSSPRCIKSHLAIDLIPEEVLIKKPKMIYTMRNPKDVCVSYYFHSKMLHKLNVGFEEFCELFLSGNVGIGSIFYHYFSYWNNRKDLDILFVHYEEMKTNTRNTIKEIAKFLNKSITEENIDAITEFLNFQKMQENKSCNLQTIIDLRRENEQLIENGTHFIRKGIVGDYKNHMSTNMIERFDKWIKENLQGSDLKI